MRLRQPAAPPAASDPTDPSNVTATKDKVEMGPEGAAPAADPDHPSLWGKIENAAHKTATYAEELLVPSNFPNSVSKDYAITRKWQLARDLAGNVAWGYAAGMALSSATIPGLAAVGLSLFAYNLVKDRLSQVVGFATSTVTPMAARNPRAWLLGGDILDSAGVAMTSAIALAPQLFVPLSIGIGLMQTFAGSMRGAAGADIGRRQAVSDNLGELNAKNGNQGLIINNLGLAIGGGLFAAMSGAFGAATLPIIGTVAAGVGLYATGRMLANLDMNPVNEAAVRKIVDAMEKNNGEIPGPERENVWGSLGSLFTSDKINVGKSDDLLKKDPARFEDLKKLYADKKYVCESVKGKPFIAMSQESTPEDRFQAVFQGVEMERLKQTDEYKDVLAKQGEDKADFWLVDQSLAKTPKDVKPLLDKIKAAGWSTDMLRFLDSGVRTSAAELGEPAPAAAKTAV